MILITFCIVLWVASGLAAGIYCVLKDPEGITGYDELALFCGIVLCVVFGPFFAGFVAFIVWWHTKYYRYAPIPQG